MNEIDLKDRIIKKSKAVFQHMIETTNEFSPMIHIWNPDGEAAICVVEMFEDMDVDPRRLLSSVIKLLAVAGETEYLVLAVDSHMIKGGKDQLTPDGKLMNPVTGEEIKQGDLAKLAELPDGKEKFGVSDAFVCNLIRREDQAIVTCSYPYHREDGKVVWDENEYIHDEWVGEPVEMTGEIARVLREAMLEPVTKTLIEIHGKDPSDFGFDDTPDGERERILRQLTTATKELINWSSEVGNPGGIQMAISTRSMEERRIVEESSKFLNLNTKAIGKDGTEG